MKSRIDLTENEIVQLLLKPYTLDDLKNTSAEETMLEYACELKEYLQGLIHLNKKICIKSISENKAQQHLEELTKKIILKSETVEKKINRKIIVKKIKQNFRKLAGEFVCRSNIIKRAYDKPRGYPGDYRTIELVYDNKAYADGIGFYFDRLFLNNEYAVAVRNRKDEMKNMLIDFIRGSEKGTIHILNLACGSCREIYELFEIINVSGGRTVFTLVDQDEEALRFSKNILHRLYKKTDIRFIKDDIYNFIKDEVAYKQYSKRLDHQDLIYTIGLSDYLPDRALVNLVKFCYKLLLPGGKLILAHKDIDRYKPLLPDWFCDWTFYPRNKDDLVDLIGSFEGINVKNIKIDYEKSGIIFFLTLEKDKPCLF